MLSRENNIEAQRFVNDLCHQADIPLIEIVIAGFYGKVQVFKWKTECYD